MFFLLSHFIELSSRSESLNVTRLWNFLKGEKQHKWNEATVEPGKTCFCYIVAIKKKKMFFKVNECKLLVEKLVTKFVSSPNSLKTFFFYNKINFLKIF